MQTVSPSRFPHVPADAGDTYNVIGEMITFKLMNADTGGASFVAELHGQPGSGPPLHTHLSSETFSILEGKFEFSGTDEGTPYTIRATPGATVFIPSGVPHTYSVVGSTAGKAVMMFSPGADMENFFSEAGVPVRDGQAPPSGEPDIPAMIAIAQKHGMSFMRP